MAHRFTSDPTEVSERMKLIRSRNTKPELALFAILDDARLSYEKHVRVEGISVDALVDESIAVFVDSPFWHLRELADLHRLTPYWRRRLLTNRRRDSRQTRLLRSEGYSVVRIWADDMVAERVLRTIRSTMTRRHRRRPAEESKP